MDVKEIIKQPEDSFISENRGNVYRALMEALEKNIIEKVFYYCRMNKLETARVLGINRNTLHAKLKRHRIR